MSELLTDILSNCYASFLCVGIIVCFLIANRKYEKSVVRIFILLCALVLMETVGSTVERYLGNQTTYSPLRLFLSWLCYLTGPALTLTIAEVNIRHADWRLKWAISIPEFLDIFVTSTCFFCDWCFTFDTVQNHFMPGPLIFIPRYMPVVYLVILIIVGFSNVRKSKWECLIIVFGSFCVLFDMVIEMYTDFPGSIRETTVTMLVLAYFIYITAYAHFDEVQTINRAYTEAEEKNSREMVEQCIETLAYTIDAKDRYTKGHSFRVAKYARMIAQKSGKSEEDCRNIYLSGLLHDIGKISISGKIINKPGRLTDEEYAKIKTHPERGAIILEKMKNLPFLQDGARYHHERFDGKGYPTGISGFNIPDIARVIAVADAYDAMTSYRTYRPTMEQTLVRQEIEDGMGKQFDPFYAKIMLEIIDADTEYELREHPDIQDEITFNDKKGR